MKIHLLIDWTGFTYYIGLKFHVLGKEKKEYAVTNIVEHEPKSKNDKWFYDVHFSDNTVKRYFEVKEVSYYPEGYNNSP